jgi:uncharacterized membrane protein
MAQKASIVKKTAMTRIAVLFERVGIASGLIASLDSLGVAFFLLLKGAWHAEYFLRLLLLALMFEGLVIALIGCLSFLGLEKYRTWLGRGEDYRETQDSGREISKEKKARGDIGVFLLTLGILLFLISFAGFSFEF